ncbi:hypothetical protein [Sporosarcina sp. ANT_H38]|nr:hypothetical protein [Sporosarcina sp. ANT_H38]
MSRVVDFIGRNHQKAKTVQIVKLLQKYRMSCTGEVNTHEQE